MSNRRSFIQKLGMASAAAITGNIMQPAWSRNVAAALNDARGVSPAALASEEDFGFIFNRAIPLQPILSI
jgi:phosphate starvation-inducible protein PhoH